MTTKNAKITATTEDGTVETECETCSGDGETFEDRADHRGEHYTVQLPCPDCDGAGMVDDEGPAFGEDYADDRLPDTDRTGAKDSPL